MSGRGALAALALLLAMAGTTGVLSNSSTPPRPVQSTSSSTLPYSADPADRRPVVPWLATPAPPVPGPPAPVPPCQAAQLRVVDVYAEGATGHAADFVEVENSSEGACSIDGRPVVELRDARGRLVARSGESGPFISSGLGTNHTPGPLLVPARSVQLRPERGLGERTLRSGLPFFTLAQGPCPGGVFPDGAVLLLVLPGGRGSVPVADADLPLPFDYRCDLSPGAYPPPGRPKLLVGNFQGEPVSRFVDHPGVTVEIEAPPRARAGFPLRYRVRTRVLQNIDLGIYGCPGYTQGLGDLRERRPLNCAPLEDALGRFLLVDQRFDMILPIPKGTPPGRRTLTWELDPPFLRARAITTVQVVR